MAFFVKFSDELRLETTPYPNTHAVDYSKFAAYHFDPNIRRAKRNALYIDEVLDGEQVDEKWAKSTEEQVEKIVGDWSQKGIRLQSTTCRSTICRMTVGVPEGDVREEFMLKIMGEPPFNTHGYAHIEHHDDTEIEVYFARPGHRVPELPRDPT